MKAILAIFGTLLLASGCVSKDNLKKTMLENPEILFEVIEKNPEEFLKVVNKAAADAQAQARSGQAKAEEQRLEEEYKNPKTPNIDGEIFLGKADAPIVVVEYSDFECPYCSRGYDVVKRVKEVYGDKVKFIYKHLPLDFHPKAMPAAQMFEAIALQDVKKAFKFHDKIFENQGQLKTGGLKWLEKIAKNLGINVSKMKKDMTSAKVKTKIDSHIAEAKKYGITGTPGFIINGVTLKGAYPFPDFKKIIDRHLSSK